jgi:putative hydrolase of HD superfamily
MLLADQMRARGVAVNGERLLRLAVVHDWAEVRTGDMPRIAAKYYGAEARQRAERAAFEDVVGPLGDAAAIYRALHEDYEERASLEARLVKAADVIDLLAQVLVFERAGVRGLAEFWEGAEERDFQLDGTAAEVVRETVRALIEERSRMS